MKLTHLILYGLNTFNDREWGYDASAGHPDRLIWEGEFSNIEHNPILQTLHFAPVKTRHLLLRAVKMVHENDDVAFDKIGVEAL